MNTGCLFTGLILFVCASFVRADITVMNTRIIYPEQAKSISVQINNIGKQPALIQAWLDQGNSKEIPESHLIPFILTPSLTRIEAQKGQKLRLIFKPRFPMAQDRESLYWFNILDVPPSDQAFKDQNKLRLSIRTRLKLFYRPKDLKISPQKAYALLEFRYLAPESTVSVSNPSPYFITLNRVNYADTKMQDGEKPKSFSTSLLVAPFSTENISSSKLNLKSKQNISYEVINDSGGYELFSSQVK